MNDNKYETKFEPFEVSWRSPANIALVKYWGKFGLQLPLNPSISFSLKNSTTTTTVLCSPREASLREKTIEFEFEFAGEKKIKFQKKIESYLHSILYHCPFLKDVKLKISSNNLFPHSAGIASSASSMSSLALCLSSIEKKLNQVNQLKESEFLKKASFLARLGSGSACRSIYGNFVTWGESTKFPQFSNEYSFALPDVHESFLDICDTILIVDSSEKKVSSTLGHSLMKGHVFADSRLAQANTNFELILDALRNGDIKEFGRIVEAEALTLHALMMTSNPPYLLIKSETLAIIESVHSFRKETGLDVYFTLDAGANIHLLYLKESSKEVSSFINSELLKYTENNKVLNDQIGSGPCQIQ